MIRIVYRPRRRAERFVFWAAAALYMAAATSSLTGQPRVPKAENAAALADQLFNEGRWYDAESLFLWSVRNKPDSDDACQWFRKAFESAFQRNDMLRAIEILQLSVMRNEQNGPCAELSRQQEFLHKLFLRPQLEGIKPYPLVRNWSVPLGEVKKPVDYFSIDLDAQMAFGAPKVGEIVQINPFGKIFSRKKVRRLQFSSMSISGRLFYGGDKKLFVQSALRSFVVPDMRSEKMIPLEKFASGIISDRNGFLVRALNADLVYQFDTDAKFISIFPPDDFPQMTRMRIVKDDQRILLYSSSGKRVRVYYWDGSVDFQLNPEVIRMADVDLGPLDLVYVLDSATPSIRIFRKNGEPLVTVDLLEQTGGRMGPPRFMEVLPNGDVYIFTTNPNWIWVFTP